jgi:hypothetical protein
MVTPARRFIVALVAVALSSQLVQGQVMRCGQMDLSGAGGMTSESMQSSLNVSSSDNGGQTQEPASSSCILSGQCLSVAAVQTVSRVGFNAVIGAPVVVYTTRPVGARSPRPEPPPPRL